MSKTDSLSAGTRVQFKAPHWDHRWNRCGTMLASGVVLRDGRSDPLGTVQADRPAWAKMHDQTPNPEHALAVADQKAWTLAAIFAEDDQQAGGQSR